MNVQKSQYRVNCLNMAVQVVRTYQLYLGVTADRLRLYPPSHKIEKGEIPNVPTERALELRKDAYYHLGLGLVLTPPRQLLPQNVLTYRLMFKHLGPMVRVKCGPDCESYEIPTAGPAQAEVLDKLCTELYRLADDHLRESFDDFVQQRQKNRPIGFRTDEE